MNRDQAIRAIKDTLRRHPFVTYAALFGSFARGEDTESSDIDLMIDYAPVPDLLALGGLSADLEDAVGRRVDVVPGAAMKGRVIANAYRDMTPIYAKDGPEA